MEGTPSKKERNDKIFILKEHTTFKNLAIMFHLSEKRVKEIYYRECEVRGIAIKKRKKTLVDK